MRLSVIFKKDTIRRLHLALRRRYLFWFRKKYIQESLVLRKGHCLKCPCCYTPGLFKKNGRCKYLKGNSCLIYNSKIPPLCKLYPLDEQDKIPFSKKHCGYYWTKKDLKKLKEKHHFTF